MPFQDINISEILKTKFLNEPELEEEFKDAENELEIILEITQARKLSGLSQKDVAEKAGIKQQAVSRLENRENSPSLKTLIKVLKVLNLKIEISPEKNNNLTA